MIDTRDIGKLFSVMRATYGHLWPHGADDVDVWLKRLGGFQRDDIIAAANQVPNKFQTHPPTLGQFEALVSGPKPRANTYLPAPERSRAATMANRVMRRSLMRVGGVDSRQLQLMVDLKNALVEDCAEVTREWMEDIDGQFLALAQGSDDEKRALEVQIAREQYCRKQGMVCRGESE